MKYITNLFFGFLIVTLLSALPVCAATYYADATNGDDYNNGLSPSTAWKTIAKVNNSGFDPGDEILFKRGEVWREQLTVPSSGSSGNPIIFGAYGIGNKPKILGSIDLSAAGSWTHEGGNLWYATSAVQIGNMIFNNEASVGTKCPLKTNLNVQGKFWWDDPNDRVYLYSTSNPGTFYTAIEAAQKQRGIQVVGKGYITIDGFDVRYAGNHGILVDGAATIASNVTIQNNTISWIGGVYTGTPPKRYGNGIEIWCGVSNIIVRYNKITQAYDDGFTTQGNCASQASSNIDFYYNIVSLSHYGFEAWNQGAGSTTDGVRVYNNSFYDIGGGWSWAVRSDQYGGSFVVFDSDGRISNGVYKNNIHNLTANKQISFEDDVSDLADWTIDYNLYYPDGSELFHRNAEDSTNFADWKTATSQDGHSMVSNPLFVSTSDFHLQETSPCIDKGTYVGLTSDYQGNHVPFGPAPDIGAYEYYSGLRPPTGLRVVP